MRHTVASQNDAESLLEGDNEMAGFSIRRKDLYEEIWSLSATKVAEKYELSYTRLLKACKENQIPVPPAGYFTKLSTGKPVERAPLPESNAEIIVIEAPKPKQPNDPVQKDALLANQMPESAVKTKTEPVAEEDEHDKIPLRRYGDREREEREKLFLEVWEKPVSEVAKEYHISDNALRKRCIRLNVPLPERGYWARLKAGKTVNQPGLPALELPQLQRPKTGDRRKLHNQTPTLAFLNKKDREEILSFASILRVGSSSSPMLDPVRQMEIACKEWSNPKPQETFGNYYYIHQPTNPPYLADAVSPKSYSRVFHLIDALLRALLPYVGSMDYDHTLRVNGEPVSFSITEAKDSVLHEITQAERLQMLEYEEERRKSRYARKPQISKYDHLWSGKLKIVIQEKFVFEDCKRYVLEDRIGEIFISLFEASYAVRLQRMKSEVKWRMELEEQRKKEERKRQYNEEVDRTIALVNAAQDYATACMIRSYVEAIRQASNTGETDPDWLDWAAKKADWFDPTVAREDEWFGKRCHQDNPDRKKLERRW